MEIELSQIMFFTNFKLALVLSLVSIAIYIIRNIIGRKLAFGIIIILVGIILLGIDKILEMCFGAVAGALIFSHIQDFIEKRVEYESKHS